MSEPILTKRGEKLLGMLLFGGMVLIASLVFGRGGIPVIITSIIDLPTIFTVLIARYGKTTLRVVIWTLINVIIFEMVHMGASPTYSGGLFGAHLAVQGIIALLIRIRFRKRRSSSIPEHTKEPPLLTAENNSLDSAQL